MSIFSRLFGSFAKKEEPRHHHYIVEDPALRPALLEIVKLQVYGFNRAITDYRRGAQDKEGTDLGDTQKTAELIGWPVPARFTRPGGDSNTSLPVPVVTFYKDDFYVTVPNFQRIAKLEDMAPFAEMARQWQPPAGLRRIDKLPRGALLAPLNRDLQKAGLPTIISVGPH